MSEADLSRRAALSAGAGAVALSAVACSTYGSSPPAAPPAQSGGVLGKTSEIEVGGGKVFTAEQVVVTQPEAGTFKAFSAVCTHQACIVSEVSGGTINCTCHGSKFKVSDGSVASGPAKSPLAAKNVAAQGDSLVLG